ncbi:MAG: GNAT family N-acetyltransferase [Ruminococcaceae bacterium]|nr:GNAT family N-acetyltransferase [Oscillospiraceae bacterium]
MELRKANYGDVPSVSKIYDIVRGGEFCVWNENYPTMDDARRDFEAGCLYVLLKDGEIIGCASVEPVAEDDDLPFWRVNDGTHREISRIAIAPAHQGRGYARVMVELLTNELKNQGVTSIHLLAAKVNRPAVNTYRKLGYDFIGECYRYGADYFVCEKVINK